MLAAWPLKKYIIFSIPFLLALAGVVIWLFVRKTIRTRFRVARQLRDDPDINEWLVVFNWSRKVLYIPTIVVSIGACIAMLFIPETSRDGPRIVGGIWLGVFFLNFLVDEYELSIKVLLIGVLFVGVAALWLVFMDWGWPFLRLFRHLGIRIDHVGYLVFAVIFFVATVVSWIRGLFYYAGITPNYLNLQVGPTETGEQISREDYNTRVDTGDFLERLLGFGRIVVTFRDQRRLPMMFLVGRIGKKVAKLESIKGKLALDRHQPGREGAPEMF